MVEAAPFASDNIFEDEVAMIAREVEARRAQLEREEGIVDQKELIRQVMAERIQGRERQERPPIAPETAPGVATPSEHIAGATAPAHEGEGSYLDTLDEEWQERIAALLHEVEEKGLKHTIARVRSESPFLLDAFHDALVDKMYDVLVEKGYIEA